MKTNRQEVFPDAVHLSNVLNPAEQQELASQCLALGQDPAGFYTPRLRNGSAMRLKMLCLGRHWNPQTYRYEAYRSDHDQRAAPPLPANLAELASRIAELAGMEMVPDVCIVNRYNHAGRLGLHQDKDESRSTLKAGVPIVSLSLGDTAQFLVGGFTRSAPTTRLPLASGDAFVFGGRSRLRYHGIESIVPHTGPTGCGSPGRINLTFRQGACA